MPHHTPFIPKTDVTIIAIDSGSEATALRATLEALNYRVAVQWVGSRTELLKLLAGEISSSELLVLSCHGVAGGIYLPNEDVLSPKEIGEIARLQDKTVLSLGCKTGSLDFQEAFHKAGVTQYIAPTEYPEGSAALLFAARFFYELHKHTAITQAVAAAASSDEETGQFRLF